MDDVIITGAARGIGRALCLALSANRRHIVVARSAVAAGDVVRACAKLGKSAEAVVGDLSTIAEAKMLGERLSKVVRPGATLVHNAGIWPVERQLNNEGYEASYVVNCLAPLALQKVLMAQGLLKRILVIGAGMMIKGKFDAERTPAGLDFSKLRTYADTKLAGAVAMREVGRAHPEIDMAVIHPGVVRTDLGAAPGVLGWLLRQVKRTWEEPAVTGDRLARVMARERWSSAGEPAWMVLEKVESWPTIADDVRESVAAAVALAKL